MKKATCWKDGYKDESIVVEGKNNTDLIDNAAIELGVNYEDVNVVFHDKDNGLN